MQYIKSSDISETFLSIDDMSCVNCENVIEKGLNKVDGILKVDASFNTGKVYVKYNNKKVDDKKITKVVADLGYSVNSIKKNRQNQEKVSGKVSEKASGTKSNLWLIAVICAFIIFFVIIKNTVGFNYLPKIQQNAGYGMLFVIGLLTSIHCVIMCGGINISVCSKYAEDKSKKSSAKSSALLYNIGRVISYTVIGGIVGAIGSSISFNKNIQAIVIGISGILMLIIAINMLGIFPFLKKLNFALPKFLRRKITNKIETKKRSKTPFIVGLLNGIMPCGPLQMMQIYALGTGSIIKGALSMFFFSLGTVPLMLTVGTTSSWLNKKFGDKMLKLSGILVCILSLFVISRAVNMAGISIDSIFPKTNNQYNNTNTNNTNTNNSNTQSNKSNTSNQNYGSIATIDSDEQVVTTTIKKWKIYATHCSKKRESKMDNKSKL